MTCSQCNREGPDGRFCTWCGARQAPGAAGLRPRFAASPKESVASPAVLTTLFPHLAEREVNEFRWAFVVGTLVLVGLYAAGLITAALIVAAILVPILYTMYLYEARVYRDAPIPITLGTIGGGFLVGIVATLVLDAVIGARAASAEPEGASFDVGRLALATVVIPVLKEIVKPMPALLLRNRGFAQSIDGLVFGIAAGLGFAAAETIVHFSAVITGLPAQSEPGMWIVPLLTVGILMPLLHGSATGLITAALWRPRAGQMPGPAVLAVVAAIGAHIAFALGGQLIQFAQLSPVVSIVWQVVVVGTLLVAVRVTLDRLLREEATDMGLTVTACSNCGSEVTAAGFCPACGVAIAATPRTGARSPEAAASRAEGGRAR